MRYSLYISILLFFILAGCKTDSTANKEWTEEDLIGEWEIYYATRNGNITKSLEKGNFVFQADNSVTSNLLGAGNSLNFTYDKGTINITGDPNMESMKILKLQNDTLVMSSKMKIFEMEFHLKKK